MPCRYGVALTYYGISLNISGFGLNIYLTHFIYAAIEVPAKLSIYFILNFIGRRSYLATTLLLTGTCIVINIFIPEGCKNIVQNLLRRNVTRAFCAIWGVAKHGLPSGHGIYFTTLRNYSMHLHDIISPSLNVDNIIILNTVLHFFFHSFHVHFFLGLWHIRATVAVLGKGLSEASFTIIYLYTTELYPTVVRSVTFA